MICLQVLHPIKNYSSQVSFETYLHCYKITGENKSFSTSAFKYLFVNKKSAHRRITSFLFVFLKKKERARNNNVSRVPLHTYREEISGDARFRANAVIIKPYCHLKIELSSFDIHIISFRNTGFLLFVAFLSMAYLLLFT